MLGLEPTTQKATILIVEDELVTRALLKNYFEKEYYRVSEASNGEEMWKMLEDKSFDLILLDINMPGEDGFSLIKNIRINSDIGIIIVSSRTDDMDRILGLELGADDYVAKPFNERELLVRVRNLLKRAQISNNPQEPQTIYRFNGWILNQKSRNLTSPNDVRQHLTNGEFNLLVAFAELPCKVLTRDYLLNAVSSKEWIPNDRTIDVMVNRLRRIIEEDNKEPKLLVTVHGVGYQFLPQSD
jgi:two-component system, OmpR family, torCAD operon response regulator TorR